jgi:hypothetical protein
LQCAIDMKVKLVLNLADVHMKSWSPPDFSLPWQNVLQHLTEFTRRRCCLQMEFCWKTYDLHWVWCEGISIGQVVIGLIIFSQSYWINYLLSKVIIEYQGLPYCRGYNSFLPPSFWMFLNAL